MLGRTIISRLLLTTDAFHKGRFENGFLPMGGTCGVDADSCDLTWQLTYLSVVCTSMVGLVLHLEGIEC